MQFPPRLRQGVWQSNTTDLVAPRASPEPASPYLCIYIILYLYLPVPSPELPEATPRSTLALRRCVFQDQSPQKPLPALHLYYKVLSPVLPKKAIPALHLYYKVAISEPGAPRSRTTKLLDPFTIVVVNQRPSGSSRLYITKPPGCQAFVTKTSTRKIYKVYSFSIESRAAGLHIDPIK